METSLDFDSLYVELENKLNLIAEKENLPLKKMASSLTLIRSVLQELREKVLAADFADIALEIKFFKVVKPRFYSLQILETELYHLENCRKAATLEELKAYYAEELRAISRFLNQYAFQYEYYRMQANELDSLCFVRGAALQSMLVTDLPDNDPEFTAAWDYLFAKFRALEMLRDHILHLLEGCSGQGADLGFIRPGRKAVPLKWTGDVIHAVELGYSIWVSDQVNGGEAELADVMHWLSTTLDVDLSRYTRLFVEIKARKILSPTKFLDLMKDAVTRYMNQGDAYKPMRKAKRIIKESV